METKIDLEKFLFRKGINQTQLAELIGTSPANVNRWATGVGVPSHALCRSLLLEGMTVRELFGIDLPSDDGRNMGEEELERRVKDVLIRALQK